MTRCVIFDLDGTLVDSEGLGNQAFLDLVPDLSDDLASLVQRYRGMRFTSIVEDLESRLRRKLPEDFELRYRQRALALFEVGLEPTPGTVEMLERLEFARCVASSGPRAKIELALRVAGLAKYFGDRLFSSYDVDSWKPEPGLFLHAASQMGFLPDECAVVEDSCVGVEAAVAAGMRVIVYAPDAVSFEVRAHEVVRHMAEIPEALASL